MKKESAPVILGAIAVSIIIGLFIWLLVVTWPTGLSNEQIVERSKYCNDNGYEANKTYNGFTYDVTKVTCGDKL